MYIYLQRVWYVQYVFMSVYSILIPEIASQVSYLVISYVLTTKKMYIVVKF